LPWGFELAVPSAQYSLPTYSHKVLSKITLLGKVPLSIQHSLAILHLFDFLDLFISLLPSNVYYFYLLVIYLPQERILSVWLTVEPLTMTIVFGTL
jgi:hypothetical protein